MSSTANTIRRPLAKHHGSRFASEQSSSRNADLRVQGGGCASGSSERYLHPVEQRAKALLRSSAYEAIRNLSCRFVKGALVLQGSVPSFYMKQMAQTLMLPVANGDVAISNQIEVHWG